MWKVCQLAVLVGYLYALNIQIETISKKDFRNLWKISKLHLFPSSVLRDAGMSAFIGTVLGLLHCVLLYLV